MRLSHLDAPYSRGREGFTLIEVFITTSVLLIGLLALTLTLVASNSLRRSNQDRQRAQNAMRAIVEQIHSISDSLVEDALGWPRALTVAFGPGGTPGDTLVIPELSGAGGLPAMASVQVIVNETVTDLELGVSLGMPRDLNGDGLADETDVSDSALLLPVTVSLQWSGIAGDRSIVQSFYLLRF